MPSTPTKKAPKPIMRGLTRAAKSGLLPDILCERAKACAQPRGANSGHEWVWQPPFPEATIDSEARKRNPSGAVQCKACKCRVLMSDIADLVLTLDALQHLYKGTD